MIDTRGVWGHAPPELGFEIASEAIVESSACSYLLKPVKPLETLNEAARTTISHKRDVSCLEGLTYSLFGRLPSFTGMHHFTYVNPDPISCAALVVL